MKEFTCLAEVEPGFYVKATLFCCFGNGQEVVSIQWILGLSPGPVSDCPVTVIVPIGCVTIVGMSLHLLSMSVA